MLKPLLSIQYLRAFAALGVVAFHSGRATMLGQAGVDVFFVISGFIMWMVTARPVGPGRFLWHRVIRVVPMYWIATLIAAALRGASTADTARSLLFWPYYDADNRAWPVLLQGWTLNMEMFFYLLFALTLLIPRRFRLLSLTAVLCVLGLGGLAFHLPGAVWHTYTSPLLLEFLAGVWLSELARREKFPGFSLAVAMVAIGVVGFLASLLGTAPGLWRCIVWGVPSGLIVYGAISIEHFRGLPSIGSLKLLGDGSYSIYLFHPFVFALMTMSFSHYTAIVPVLTFTFLGGAIGMAAFYLLERPLTILLSRSAGRVVLISATSNVSETGTYPRITEGIPTSTVPKGKQPRFQRP